MAQTLQPINLRSALLKYLYHWPLFLLGLCLTFAIAFYYLKFTNPTYEVKAVIAVKDVKKTTEERSALKELEQSSQAKIAENEVEIISSRKLITQVVNQLQLETSYTTKDGLKTIDLYKKSPISFTLEKEYEADQKSQIRVTLKEAGFTLLQQDGSEKEFAFGQSIKSGFGVWKLSPTGKLKEFLGKEIVITVNPKIGAAEAYQKALQVSLINKLAPTISLTINDKVTQRGQDFLNALISNYILASTSEKSENSNMSIGFIDKKLDSLRTELNAAEGAVEVYKSGNSLTDINSESKSYLESSRINEMKLNDTKVQINIIEGIEHYVNSPQNSNTMPSTIGIADNNLAGLIDKLSDLQLQKAKLLATTPESNYIFEPINNQLKITKNAIIGNVRSIKASLLSTKRQLESFNAKVQGSIRQIPGQERQSESLIRQQKAKEDLYNYLLQKRAELSLSYTATLSDARVVDSAYIGNKIWPQTTPIMAISGLFGLLMPFLIVYTRNALGNKILTKGDIERNVKIPILGELPNEYLDKNSLVDHSVNNVLSEHFRAIRTKLYYLDKTKEKGRVILITSSVSGEGKSFVSANLSTSLAFMGRKTILLELDLRKPKLAKTFNLESSYTGLTEYLSSDINVNDIIQKSNFFEKLDVISAGQPVNNPAELLTLERLSTLIKHLQENYDDIIIDSPPLHLVTDAMIISRLTDITLYVIRQGVTDKAELDFINELEQQNELPNINIIFNGVAQGKFGYGNHYTSSYYSKPSSFSVKKSMSKFLSRF
ncbi:MAG: polysaccharide biosynthesis tyrosine autokinase [Pedobacter sp.]|nr:MAG: polysaccharide biosynthesis tyrosine autokinase [Pedobacter sp.]